MKKLLKIFALWLLFLSIFTWASSADSCVTKELWNNTICVGIEKTSSSRYSLNRNINCRDNSCAVSCRILLPDNTQVPVGTCNGSFYYDSNSSEKVKLYITINNKQGTIEWYYNFRNWSWWNIIDNWDDDDDDDNDYIQITTNNKNPSTSEYVRLTINTDDDYTNKVYLSAKYRSSTSDSWSTVSNTSSSYFSNYSDEWEQGYYKMKSSDDWYKVLSNLLKFKKKGYYRITAKDIDWNTSYIDFNVWNSSTSYDEVKLSANKTNPNTSEYIRLTIDTDDDYYWNISFYKVQYKSTSSSSWTTISSRTNSNYFSNYSDEWEQGYYRMKSSDNWHKVISNFLKFAKKWYYRIYAEDTNWNYDYIDFNVGWWSSYYDNDIELSTNDKNPSTSKYIDLTIETDDDYVGKVYLSAKYRSSTSNSWSSISNTSSTYFTNRSTAWSNGYISITSSNNWYKKISDAFKFAKKWYYKIIVEDEYGNTDYIEFNVWNSSSSYDYLEISASPTSPNVWSYIQLTIDTDEDYYWNISFYKVQYRASDSSTRTTISSRTNSTYFSYYSNEWEQGYYRMKSSDNWHKVISNFLKFAKKWYYRIYAEDTNWNYDYIDFYVWNPWSYYDYLELSADDTTPSASEYIDLTIEADSSYRWKIYFSAKYRSSTSNSWNNISITSTTYFTNRSTTWNNGYLTMTSTDRWEKTVENIFKFAKKGYYRIYITDEYNNSTYLDFDVWYTNYSPLDWFTQKEFDMIERIYNVWPTLISNLRSQYPRLRNNSSWRDLSDELYDNMWDVVNMRSNRKFKDYDDFDTAFRYRFTRTQNLMD